MKSIILCLTNDIIGDFDTVEAAKEFAIQYPEAKEFTIYSLYSIGKQEGITWKLATDNSINGLENKKATKAVRKGLWSPLEIDTILQHYTEDDMPITEIAEKLHRSYNSVYLKLRSLEAIEKK